MGAAASTILQKAPSKLDADKLKELVGEERYDHKTFEIVCGEDGFVSKAVLTAHVMRVAAEEAAQKKAEGESGEDDDGLGYFIEQMESGHVVLVRARWLIQLYDRGVAEAEAAAKANDPTEAPAKVKIPSRAELPNLAELHKQVDVCRDLVREEFERIAPKIRESKNAEANYALKQELREKELELTHAEQALRHALFTFGDVEDLEKGPKRCQVAVVSAPWITKEHPDPDGFHLSKVVPILRWYLNIHEGQELLVFWDFMSLHQHGHKYSRASILAVVEGPPLPNGRPSDAYDVQFDSKDDDVPGVICKAVGPEFFSRRLGEKEVVASEIKIGTRSARVATRMPRFKKQQTSYEEALKKVETWYYSRITLKIIQDIHPPDAPVDMKRYKERAWCQFELKAALAFTPVKYVVSCQLVETSMNFFEPTKKVYYNAKNRQLPTIDEFMKLKASESLDGFMAYLERCEGVKPVTWGQFMSMRPGDPKDKHRPKALQFSPLRRVAPPTPDQFGEDLMDLAVAERADRQLLDKKWTQIYRMAYEQKEDLYCDELGWAFPMDNLELIGCMYTLEVVDFSDNPDMTGTLDLFQYLKVLKSLSLVRCNSITGTLKPLQKMLGLEYLNLQACYNLEGTLDALEPLEDLLDLYLCVDPSVEYDCDDAEEVTMGFTGTLEPLKGCQRLRFLDLRGCTKLEGTLAPLAQCKTLRSGATHRAYMNFEYCMELDGNLELDNGLQVVPGVTYGDPEVIDREPERKLTLEEVDRLERGLPLLVPFQVKTEPADIAKAPLVGNCKPIWSEGGRPVSPSRKDARAAAAAAAAAAVAGATDELPADEYEAAKVLKLRHDEEERRRRQIEEDAFIPESDVESHGYSTDHDLGSVGDYDGVDEPSQLDFLPPCVQGNKEPYFKQAPDPKEFLEMREKMIQEEHQRLKDEAIATAKAEEDA
jgi:hypothetical protein